MKNENKNLIVSLSDAAALAGVSKDTIRRWEKSGKLKGIRTKGGHRRFKTEDVKNAFSHKEERQKKQYVGLASAASIAGVSTDTIRRWTNSGKLESKRTKGGHRRFLLDDINNIHEESFQPQTPKPMHVFEAETKIVPNLSAEAISSKNKFSGRKYIQFIGLTILITALLVKGPALIYSLTTFLGENKSEALVEFKKSLGQVLASRDSLNVSWLEFNIDTFFNSNVTVTEDLNVSTINPNTVLEVSGDTNIAGSLFANSANIEGSISFESLILNDETLTDVTGTGLQITNGVLSAVLGLEVTSSEITDATITEADLSITNSPTDNQILSYDSTTGTFTWVNDENDVGENSPWTESNSFIVLDTLTANVSVGGNTNLAKLGIDGDTDELQLLVQGVSDQTENLTEWQGSDGTILSYIDSNGSFVGSVTGTLVTGFSDGSVLFTDASGNLTQDNTNFFWDDTSNFLGIGTNTPSVALEVAGDVEPETGSLYDLGSNTRRWATVWGDSANFTSISSTTTDLPGTTSDDFRINTDNATLDLEDATLTFERGTAATNAEFRWDSGNKYISTNAPGFFINPDSGISASGKASLIVNQVQAQDIFTASSSGTTKFVIQNNGDVGIGTANPDKKLSIYDSSTSYDFFSLTNDTAYKITQTFNKDLFGTNVPGIRQNYGGTKWLAAPDTTLNNYFVSIDPTAASGQYMHIKWDGPLAANTFRISRGSSDRLLIYDDVYTNNVLEFRGNSSNLGFTNWRNIGIGTTSPNDVLEVLSTTDSQLRLAYDTSNYQALQVASDGGLNWAATGTDADVNFDFSGATGGDFSVNTNDLFVDTSTGYVGVGTASPGSNFVISSATDHAIQVIYAPTAGKVPLIQLQSATQQWQARVDTSTFSIRDNTNGFSPLIVQALAPSNSLFINSTGNLGVGTASPTNAQMEILPASSSTVGGYIGSNITRSVPNLKLVGQSANTTDGGGGLQIGDGSSTVLSIARKSDNTFYLRNTGTLSFISAFGSNATSENNMYKFTTLTQGISGTYTNQRYVYIDQPSSTTGGGAVTNLASLYIAGAPNSTGTGPSFTNSYGLWVDGGTLTTNTSNGYGFYTTAPTGASSNFAAAFSGGNVGMGDITPEHNLDIEGYFGGNALVSFNETGSNDIFTASASGTTKFTIQNSGLTDASVDGIATLVNAGAISDGSYSGTAVNGLLGVDSSNGRLYFRYGDAWHYTAQTAGFQIPDYESFAYSFENKNFNTNIPLQEGDFLVPFVESTMSDGAKHGLYARFSDVKQELLSDIYERIDNLETASSESGELMELTVSGDSVLGDVTVTGSLDIGTLQFNGLENSINSLGVLKLQPLQLAGIDILNGKITIDKNGVIVLTEGRIAGNSSFRDSIELNENISSLRVTKSWEASPKTITATPNWNTNVWITEKDETGFTINFSSPTPIGAVIDWFAFW